MRIDVHNHVIPPGVIDLVRSDSSFGVDISDGWWRGPDHVPFELLKTFYDPATRLADLERAGLDGAVVSPVIALFMYRLDPDRAVRFARAVNKGLAEFCAAAPRRLSFLATAPLQDVPVACELLADAVGLGAVGVAVATSIAGRRLDDETFGPFWELCSRRSLPVFVHPAYNDQHPALQAWYLQNVIGNPLESAIAIERLMCSGLLDTHRGIRVVTVHGGGFLPFQLDRLRHASTARPEFAAPVDTERLLDHFFFDTVLHGPAALRFLAERVSIDRMVLGTDMPFDMAVADPLAALHAALGEAAIDIIADANPQRLFGPPSTGTPIAR
jgi:aminocarboxymuconate-semialdehyde decarboxylase